MLDRIQSYYEGGLSAEERAAFEKELANDAELQKEVALYHQMKTAITREGMKDVLEKIHSETFDAPARAKRPNGKNKWLLLVLFAAVAALIYLLLQTMNLTDAGEPENQLPPQYQYAHEIKTMEGLPVTLSVASNEQFQEGMIAYRMKDFEESARLFKAVMDSGVINDTTSIYYANALVALDRDREAEEILAYLGENPNGPYYHQSRMLYLKILLRQNRLEEAKALVQDILAGDGPDAEFVKKIRDEIFK